MQTKVTCCSASKDLRLLAYTFATLHDVQAIAVCLLYIMEGMTLPEVEHTNAADADFELVIFRG